MQQCIQYIVDEQENQPNTMDSLNFPMLPLTPTSDSSQAIPSIWNDSHGGVIGVNVGVQGSRHC